MLSEVDIKLESKEDIKSDFMHAAIAYFDWAVVEYREELEEDITDNRFNQFVEHTWTNLYLELDENDSFNESTLREIEWYIANEEGIIVSVLDHILTDWKERTGYDEYCE
jgi:hypothetical protein